MGTILRLPYTDIEGIDTTVMVAGDALGTETSITVPNRGVIETIRLFDLANQDASIDILMFDDDITTGTNGVAYDMADADADRFLGLVKVSAGDYSSLSDNSVAIVPNVGIAYECPTGTMRVQCVVRTAPTYVAAGDLSISMVIWLP